MLKLHNFERSPFGWKVRIVLAEKKVPYEAITPENKSESPEFARLNPFRLTPVLELEDGQTLYESTVINEYLDEAYPLPPMMPRDPCERARVRMLEDTTDQYFMKAIRGIQVSQFDSQPPFLVRKPADQVDHKRLEDSRIQVHENLARLEEAIQGKTWFGGDTFSLADAGLAVPVTFSLHLLGILPDPKYPGLAAWTARVKERPSYRASTPKVPTSIKEG